MKRKVLAKSSRAPNKLIKELCRREAGKSEVTVGNMRSVVKHLATIDAEAHVDPEMAILMEEFKAYIDNVRKKFFKSFTKISDTKPLKKKAGG